MDIIAAYREAGTYRGAAEIAGTTHKTVRRVIARHEAGGAAPREHNYDGRRGRKAATRDVARPPGATTHVASATGAAPPATPAAGPEPGLTAGPACPHCRKPVALVAWLVPPAAASVKEPPRHAGMVSSWRRRTM